ncbi:MAG: ABC transporter permease [Chloroflexota bacterium]
MIRVELKKQSVRLRTYVVVALMIGLPILLTAIIRFGHRQDNDRDFFALASQSGINMPLAALTAASTFLLMIVAAVFAGSSISEESNWGSLRYLLLRPISRNTILRSKLSVACLLALSATVLIATSALIAGTIAFGWHPVQTPDGSVFSQTSAMEKLAVSTLYVAWCMAGIVALAFMISSMTDSMMGAVAGAVGLGIVSQILDAISSLGGIRGWLITHYWHAWEGLFANPVSSSDMVNGVLLQIPYVILFLAVGWRWFNRRDILT